MGRPRKDQLTRAYLRLLDRRLAPLPGARWRQIREEVQAHIEEGCRPLAPEDEAGVRQVLEQLGDPEEIAREAGADPHRRTWPEALVPVLLLFGGFVLVVGWLVGAAILWASPDWRLRNKLMGTLILPFGLLGVVGLGTEPFATSCSGYGPVGGQVITHCPGGLPEPLGLVALFILVVAPFLVATHLDRVRRRA
jgi:hypothetical protein